VSLFAEPNVAYETWTAVQCKAWFQSVKRNAHARPTQGRWVQCLCEWRKRQIAYQWRARLSSEASAAESAITARNGSVREVVPTNLDPPAGGRRRAHCSCCLGHGQWPTGAEAATTRRRSSGQSVSALRTIKTTLSKHRHSAKMLS